MKRILFTSISLLFTSLTFAQTVYSNFVDGRIYLKVHDVFPVDFVEISNSNSAVSDLLSQVGATKVVKAFQSPGLSLSKVYRIDFKNIQEVDNLISSLTNFPFIQYAEKAPLYEVKFTDNNSLVNDQYALKKVKAQEAYNIFDKKAEVVIAIIDNGVNLEHEDLRENLWVNADENPNTILDDDLNGYTNDYNGYDVADMDGNPNPPAGGPSAFVHGTHCAGIAAASVNNNKGIASLGFAAKIMAIKATPDNSNGNAITNAYEGVDYALKNGADIISMSFGGSSDLLTWQVVLTQAELNGVILVAAAGNDGSNQVQYPAGYEQVISVAASDESDKIAAFSNFGPTIDVVAPGVSILSTFFPGNNTYGNLSGTSMACPLVAGLVGMMKAHAPNLSADELKNHLSMGCDNIANINPGYIGKMGSGRVNAYRSLLSINGSLNQLGFHLTEVLPFAYYPNPVKDYLTIEYPNIQSLRIFDFSGKELYSEQDISVSNGVYNIQTNQLSPGIYLLQLNNGEFPSQKFVKE